MTSLWLVSRQRRALQHHVQRWLAMSTIPTPCPDQAPPSLPGPQHSHIHQQQANQHWPESVPKSLQHPLPPEHMNPFAEELFLPDPSISPPPAHGDLHSTDPEHGISSDWRLQRFPLLATLARAHTHLKTTSFKSSAIPIVLQALQSPHLQLGRAHLLVCCRSVNSHMMPCSMWLPRTIPYSQRCSR